MILALLCVIGAGLGILLVLAMCQVWVEAVEVDQPDLRAIEKAPGNGDPGCPNCEGDIYFCDECKPCAWSKLPSASKCYPEFSPEAKKWAQVWGQDPTCQVCGDDIYFCDGCKLLAKSLPPAESQQAPNLAPHGLQACSEDGPLHPSRYQRSTRRGLRLRGWPMGFKCVRKGRSLVVSSPYGNLSEPIGNQGVSRLRARLKRRAWHDSRWLYLSGADLDEDTHLEVMLDFWKRGPRP